MNDDLVNDDIIDDDDEISKHVPLTTRSVSLFTRTKSAFRASILYGAAYEDNNGWNDHIENDAKRIGESAGGLRWMHNQCGGVFLFRYWLTVSFNILLAAIVTAFNSITGADCINSTDWNPFKIVSIVGSSLVGIITVYSGIKNYGSRVTAHQVAEGNYQALFYTIKRQLHMNRDERQNGKDFLEWIQKEYTDLTSNISSPDIPDFIFRRYEKQVKDINVAKYNDIEEIKIKEDSRGRKTSNIKKYPGKKVGKSRSTPGRGYTLRDTDDDNDKNDDDNNTTNIDSNNKDYIVTIPTTEMSEKDKWQLSRFYDNQ